ncbi:GGDEF domain-containing protein [Cryobacterium sp. 1639]|uniref:GGDEF domain-containing protein n=1 Tax=Cryobacterium inferilacus TaxID=2866629 RepID=UPI001C7329AB|nr:GGDEF domain-containing protein [Cryobacterium sp. 1639]MBX0301474.1 GGDEF domain-containing protein [Cryobacterium sp. 1639]
MTGAAADLVFPLPAGAALPAGPATDALAADSTDTPTSGSTTTPGTQPDDPDRAEGFVYRTDLPSPAAPSELHPAAEHPAVERKAAGTAATGPMIEALILTSAQANRNGRQVFGADQAEKAIELPGATADQQARARQLLAGHALRMGEFEASVRHGLLALEHFTATGDRLAESNVHCTLALAFHETALEEPALSHVERSEPLCAVMLDMDHFKEVNDQHGHAAGDLALASMAGILATVTRSTDLAVRVGGEEFLLVLGNTDPAQAVQICERLLDEVRDHPWNTLGEGLSCTASVGVALLAVGESVSRWLGRADAALYEAKAAGRNRVQLAVARTTAGH